jgi:hypothetical protein
MPLIHHILLHAVFAAVGCISFFNILYWALRERFQLRRGAKPYWTMFAGVWFISTVADSIVHEQLASGLGSALLTCFLCAIAFALGRSKEKVE